MVAALFDLKEGLPTQNNVKCNKCFPIKVAMQLSTGTYIQESELLVPEIVLCDFYQKPQRTCQTQIWQFLFEQSVGRMDL